MCDRERARAGIRCGQQANYFGTHTRCRIEGAKQPTDDDYERSRDAHDVPTSIWLCWCCASQLAEADDDALVLNHSGTEQGTLKLFADPAPEVRNGHGDEEEQDGPSFPELMKDLNSTIDRLDRAHADGDSDMARHWQRRKSEIEAQMIAAHR